MMDEALVREHAETHGRAVVSGDLRTAASSLTEEGRAAAPAIMAALPKPVTGAHVMKIEADGDEYVAHIRYSGPNDEKTVLSRWADQDGTPMITMLSLV